MKGRVILFGILVTASFLLISGCSTLTATPVNSAPQEAIVNDNNTQEPLIGMANPASVFCEEQGGTLEIRMTDTGDIGICIFPDGSECEEWAFFRGDCKPGDNKP